LAEAINCMGSQTANFKTCHKQLKLKKKTSKQKPRKSKSPHEYAGIK
jgi:hypothetical protein